MGQFDAASGMQAYKSPSSHPNKEDDIYANKKR